MADYDAIGTVSETLVELLRTRMRDRDGIVSLDRSEIALTSPDEVGSDSDTRLSLYLYKVERSDQQQPRHITQNNVRKGSPLTLTLHYLMTAYPSTAGTDVTANNRDQHSVLGLAMQVLHDHSVLDGDSLGGSFSEDARVEVSMHSDSQSSATVSRVWDTFRDVPLYPSVTYEASPVLIDSLREEQIQRVAERETKLDKKERSPLKPRESEESDVNGPAGGSDANSDPS